MLTTILTGLIGAWLTITPYSDINVVFTDTTITFAHTDTTSAILVEFNEGMDISGLTSRSNYQLRDNTDKIWKIYRIGIVKKLGNRDITNNSLVVLITPRLDYRRTYTTTVTNVKDIAGNVIGTKNVANYFFNGHRPNYKKPTVTLPLGQLAIVRATAKDTAEVIHGPDRIFDGLNFSSGDPDGRWATRPLPDWIIFELGKVSSVSQLKLSFNYFDSGRVYSYSVDYSMDGIIWVNAVPLAYSVAYEEWVYLNLTVSAKYIRLNFLTNTQSDWAGLWEVEVYGK